MKIFGYNKIAYFDLLFRHINFNFRLINESIRHNAPFADAVIEKINWQIFGEGRANRTTDVIIFNASNEVETKLIILMRICGS
jgi:hypothetical protein